VETSAQLRLRPGTPVSLLFQVHGKGFRPARTARMLGFQFQTEAESTQLKVGKDDLRVEGVSFFFALGYQTPW
jgi:hypothetical protein